MNDLATTGERPALGRGVWPVLLRNEWFKTRHRPAFFVTLAFFAFVHVMDQGDSFWEAFTKPDRSYALPDAWSSIFSGGSVMLLIFGSIAVIMLVSSEFTWRTARQNVIDGLSKTQWFFGKVILLGLVGLLFFGVQMAIGVAASLPGTDFSNLTGPIVSWSVVEASAGLLLAFASVGGLALLLALSMRSAGPAMAAWFFWIAMGEQLVPALVGRLVPALEPALGMLPFGAAQKLLEFGAYDAPTYESIVQRAAAAERAAPELIDLALWVPVNVGWALLFLGLSYLLYRRRDL
jgi:ABC-2 type transport system permease protein